jgi:hypothetical protein
VREALTYFGLGLGAGALFLGLLWVSVRRLVSGQGGVRLHALLAAARFLALGGAFFLLARRGTTAALLALAGLVAARLVILRLVRPEAA